MKNGQLVTLLLTEKTRDLILTPAAQERMAGIAEIRSASGPPENWDIASLLKGASACITGWGTPHLSADVLAASEDLGLIAHSAGSIKNLLPPELVGGRVHVCQSADVIATSVAEMVMLQILMEMRELQRLDRGLREGGGWFDLRAQHPGKLLSVQTVAVVGASRTGRAVLPLLRPFGCTILVVDPFITDEEAKDFGAEKVDLETALRRSDIVSLHAPLLPETEGMLGAGELAMMRDGSALINSARASLVDCDALLKELRSGRISAALDVFPEEPLPDGSPWRNLPNTVISPHNAGHTVDAHHAQGDAMVDEVERFLSGAPLRYEVSADMAAVLA
ncbi:MAG: hydroxyacid dehydrogenase [Arachnia sp.]